MKTILLAAAALASLATAASAAPLTPGTPATSETTNVEQVRLVCDEYGRCYRSRGPRYVQRYVDDDVYVARRNYGYYGGPRYYNRGYGSYGGPSIGFSFGNRGW